MTNANSRGGEPQASGPGRLPGLQACAVARRRARRDERRYGCLHRAREAPRAGRFGGRLTRRGRRCRGAGEGAVDLARAGGLEACAVSPRPEEDLDRRCQVLGRGRLAWRGRGTWGLRDLPGPPRGRLAWRGRRCQVLERGRLSWRGRGGPGASAVSQGLGGGRLAWARARDGVSVVSQRPWGDGWPGAGGGLGVSAVS